MKSSERLNTLNSLNSTELSTKTLKSVGLTTNDISALIKNGVIKHVKRGIYELVVKEEPIPSLEVEEEPTSLVTYELLCDTILNGEYENGITYLTKLYETETNIEVIKKMNLYTYLLSFITTLPDSLVPYTVNQDMPINRGLENGIILIRNKKFHQALIEFRKQKEEKDFIKIGLKLLEVISIKITNITESVSKSVAENDLLTAKTVLEQNPTLLYNNMKIQLHLINIILSNEIPKINYNERSYNFTDAIKNNDFKTALKFHSNFISKKDMDNNTITILLRKIIDILNQNKQKQSVKVPIKKTPKPLSRKELLRQQRIEGARRYLKEEDLKEPIPVPEVVKEESPKEVVKEVPTPDKVKEIPATKEVPSTEEKKESPKEEFQVLAIEDSKADILTILTKLMSNNNEFADTLLKTFLKELEKEKYEFLIIDLIKISYLEKDYSFLKPISTLAFISRDKFTFNLGEYIEEFYMNLANNNFEIAYLYLDIIENAKKLGITFDFISYLRMILKTSKEKYEQEYGDLKRVPKKYCIY